MPKRKDYNYTTFTPGGSTLWDILSTNPRYTPRGQPRLDMPYDLQKLMVESGFLSKVPSFMNPNVVGAPAIDMFGLGTVIYPTDAVTSNEKLKVFAKAVDKARDSELNLGAALGEGHQTVQMIGDAATRIAKAITQVRNFNIPSAIATLGYSESLSKVRNQKIKRAWKYDNQRGIIRDPSLGASRAWLELQFGWEPLLGDIHSGAEALANALNKPFNYTVKASNCKDNPSPSSKFDKRTGKQLTETAVVGNANWVSFYDYQYSLKVKLGEPVTSIATKLGMDKPYSVLWEVTPWSFLYDYVIPIGTYINAREGALKLNIDSWQETTKIIQRLTGTGLNGFEFTAPVTYESINFNRSSPHSGDTFKNAIPLPRVKPLSDILSVKHCLNSLALIRTSLMKR